MNRSKQLIRNMKGALALAFVAGGLFAVTLGVALKSDPELPDSLPACVQEDGPPPCVWDSETRGNGERGQGVERYVIVPEEDK